MGVRKELIWFAIAMLIMVLQQDNNATCFAAQVYYTDEFNRFRPGQQPNNERRGNADHQTVGNDEFGAQKRRVFTGPNPLHNR